MEELIKTITEMTRINDHTGALIRIAAHLKEEKILSDLLEIADVHVRAGFLPVNARTKRHGIYLALMTEAELALTLDEFKALKSAL